MADKNFFGKSSSKKPKLNKDEVKPPKKAPKIDMDEDEEPSTPKLHFGHHLKEEDSNRVIRDGTGCPLHHHKALSCLCINDDNDDQSNA